MSDSTKRFSNRVDNYVKYRPGYPPEVLEYLTTQCGLTSQSNIADIGAGTGIFTKLLLDKGYKVYAVEPNKPMRDSAIEHLFIYNNFIPVNGTAENTTLPSAEIDLVVCAQAFHWFDAAKSQAEFKRILKPGGKVALIWNNRLATVDEFSIAYEELLEKASTDYEKVNHRNIKDVDFKAFFNDGIYKMAKYANAQNFDEAGLIGRAASSSYVPAQGTPEGEKFTLGLKDIFAQHAVNGRVSFHYQTEIYLGGV